MGGYDNRALIEHLTYIRNELKVIIESLQLKFEFESNLGPAQLSECNGGNCCSCP